MKNLFAFIFFLFCIQTSGQSNTVKIDSASSTNGFLLEQSSQNLYGSTSFITFNLPVDANVKLFIQNPSSDKNDCKNDKVCIVYEGFLSKGYYKSTWDLKDKNNNAVENGFYDFYIVAESKENNIYKMSFKGNTRIVVLR